MSALVFVAESGAPRRSRNAEDRKIVRAQAMRDYRRKKKQDLIGESGSDEGALVDVAALTDIKTGQTALVLRPTGSGSWSKSTLDDVQGTQQQSLAIPEGSVVQTCARKPKFQIRSHREAKPVVGEKQHIQLSPTQNAFRKWSFALVPPPSFGPSEGVMDSLIEKCWSGIQSWTTPLTDSYDVLPMQVSYAELSKLNKSILLAIYLSYRVLLGVLGEWSTTLTVSADTYYYRGRLLQSIGKALEDKGVATSDDTMHKLFNMCICDAVLGEPTVHLHLLAIRRIADSRGGIHTLQRYGGRLAGVIIVTDMMNAVSTDIETILLETPTAPELFFENKQIPSGIKTLNMDKLFFNSPLAVFEPFQDLLQIPEASLELIQILEDSFAATQMRVQQSTAQFYGMSYSEFWDTLQERVESSSKQSFLPPNMSSVRSRVTNLAAYAAAIHLRATAQLIPHPDPRNKENMRAMAEILATLNVDTWRGMPFVYLWILLTGAAAAKGQPEASVFIARFHRLAHIAHLLGLEYHRIMWNFLWLQRCIRESTFISTEIM